VLGQPTATSAGIIDLGYALKANWVGFFLQPKIALRRKQVVGLEMFARARHPLHGILQAPALLAGADSESLKQLAAFGVRSAKQISRHLGKYGAKLPITLNVPASVLTARQVATTFASWNSENSAPLLILDVPEDEMLAEFARMPHIAAELAKAGIKLAIDNFGHSIFGVKRDMASTEFERELADLCGRLTKLKVLGLADVKLAKNLTEDCGSDPRRRDMCKTVIALIHHLEASAVAIGLSKHADAVALDELGCDVGQGNLFSEPLPLDAFVGLLQEKSRRQKDRQPAGA
jgi:EAL domain-containing protein (putative c-di-GMP-specific phosphodiesterase class I)